MTVKERLHRVVDEMSDDEAETLRRIETLRSDPLVRFFDAAPIDDEPVTPEEEAATAEVERDRRAGISPFSFDEIRRRYL